MPNVADNLSTKMATALFTIEQIELIRRLRNSGITKEQVSMAFDQMDRLDVELGSKPPTARGHYSLDHDGPPTNGVSKSGNSYETCKTAPGESSFFNKQPAPESPFCSSRPQSSSNSSTDGATENGGSIQNGDASPGRHHHSPTSSTRLSGELTIVPLPTPPVPVSYSPAANDGAYGGNGRSSSSNDGASSNCVPIQCLVNPLDLLQDECYELDELKKKGEMAILSEIRNFVMRYNIKQTMIAEMTKMSQAYVSRFFRGDIQDMSDRTKNAFYMWYLTCKNNPWKLTQLCPNSGVKRMVSESGDLIPLKRERFTFKAAHLAVLERYYEKDPYPDSQTREQIVDECNKAVERADRPLAERERVTLPVVNNWFNNRRKEAKKQLRQQHAAAMAAVSVSMSPMGQSPLGLASVASMPALGWHQSQTALGGVANYVNAHQPAFHPNAQLDLSSEAMEDDSDSSRDSYANGDALSVEIHEEDSKSAATIKQEV